MNRQLPTSIVVLATASSAPGRRLRLMGYQASAARYLIDAVAQFAAHGALY